MSYWRIEAVVPRIVLTAALFFLIAPETARAQETMTEIQRLDFGLFSLRDNGAQHDLSVSATDNSWMGDGAFAVASPPQRGEYLLEGFTPGTEIFVDVDDGSLTLNGAGGAQILATVNYTVWPGTIIADGGGEATVYIGATLRTLGDASVYTSGPYSDDLGITFSW